MFFFSGRLLLWGPERVCSVRCAVAKVASRTDTVIVNVTEDQVRIDELSLECFVSDVVSYDSFVYFIHSLV